MREVGRWLPVVTELDRWREVGATARLWLRDDDAAAVTPALEALIARLRAHGAPAMIAAIPATAEPALAERLAPEPLAMLAMHGIRHANHAPPERKSEETPAERGLGVIEAELAAARAGFAERFGPASVRWYVPPWNRIGLEVAGILPRIGFAALSTYGARRFGAPGLRELNTHVDLIDWRGGRVGKPQGAVAADLAASLAMARAEGFRPVGVLTHHLAHDEAAWATLDALLALVADHPAASWSAPDALLADA